MCLYHNIEAAGTLESKKKNKKFITILKCLN